MSKTKAQHSPAFKAKVAIASLNEAQTIPQLASNFHIHPNLVYKWRKQLLTGAANVFDPLAIPPAQDQQSRDLEMASLYEQIGKLTVELSWLKKKS